MDPNNRKPIFQTLVNSQNSIGWQHLLMGRFSNHWIQIQGQPILDDAEKDQEKQSGERWLKLILHHLWTHQWQLLWTHLWQLWLARNDVLHGHEKDKKDRPQTTRKAPTTSPRRLFQS